MKFLATSSQWKEAVDSWQGIGGMLHLAGHTSPGYPHFESPQLRQVMQPSIMTNALV